MTMNKAWQKNNTSTPLDKRKCAKVVLKGRNREVADIVLESDAEYSTKYRAIAVQGRRFLKCAKQTLFLALGCKTAFCHLVARNLPGLT